MKLVCVTNQFGDKHYYLDYANNILHKEDGPAIEWADGSKDWYYYGKPHRQNKPACDYSNGYKAWYYHGERHRIDGPAIEFVDGHKSWYYHGEKIDCKNNEEFLRIIKLMVFL